jgi:DNA-directed RNA polymerase subunit RPC12/RpoP
MGEWLTSYTDLIACPYCGYEDRDSWEFSDEDGEWDCRSCGATMLVSRHVSVSYSTQKLKMAGESGG